MATTRVFRPRRSTADLVRQVGEEVRRLREDAGVSGSALARAARMRPSQLWAIEAGRGEWSVDSLNRLAAALGADLSIRLYPNTGPPIRDRHQARMVEALLRLLHPSWRATLEVPVRHPARGVIDMALHSADRNVIVAVEVQSEVRRVEQQLRWAAEKAESLPSSELWRRVAREEPPTISRLLLLRSTRATRAIAMDLEATFRTAYPAEPSVVWRSITSADVAWPGNGLLWVAIHGAAATVLERRPPVRRPVR